MKENLVISVNDFTIELVQEAQYIRINRLFFLTAYRKNRPTKISDVIIYSKKLGLI